MGEQSARYAPLWNERYAEPGYAYGTEPNDFLREQAGLIVSGPVLSLCEGEGRNGVFLAQRGLEVVGVDGSEVGLAKARALAQNRGVTLTAVVADLAEYEPPPDAFGAVIAIFSHFPPPLRRRVFGRAVAALRPGGVLLMEVYSPDQLRRATGGPRLPELLAPLEEIKRDLAGCEFRIARQVEREVREGAYHTGLASVIQIVAEKRPAA